MIGSENKTYDREGDHQQIFAKDLCTYARALSKNVCMHVKTYTAHTHLCLVRTYFYTKLYKNCIDSPLLCHDLKFKIS